MLALVDCQMDDRVFFFNDTATTEIYTLSLHDALPISRRAALGANRPRRGVHADPPHAAEVDHERIVRSAETGHTVAATPDRDGQALRASRLHGGDDVRDPGAPNDDRGPLVDHRVVHFARVVVPAVVRQDHIAAHRPL